jgi:hypothetical protein
LVVGIKSANIAALEMMATLMPAPDSLAANARPACQMPMMMASKRRCIVLSFVA